MTAAQHEAIEPGDGKDRRPKRALRAASLSALEEAVRQALEVASLEQVLQRVATSLPRETEPDPGPGVHDKVQKVSVSMPADLTDAVRARTGAGGFSRYVSEAVQERIKHDLLGELLDELEAEHGPVPDEIREQTRQLWPDEVP